MEEYQGHWLSDTILVKIFNKHIIKNEFKCNKTDFNRAVSRHKPYQQMDTLTVGNIHNLFSRKMKI